MSGHVCDWCGRRGAAHRGAWSMELKRHIRLHRSCARFYDREQRRQSDEVLDDVLRETVERRSMAVRP